MFTSESVSAVVAVVAMVLVALLAVVPYVLELEDAGPGRRSA